MNLQKNVKFTEFYNSGKQKQKSNTNYLRKLQIATDYITFLFWLNPDQNQGKMGVLRTVGVFDLLRLDFRKVKRRVNGVFSPKEILSMNEKKSGLCVKMRLHKFLSFFLFYFFVEWRGFISQMKLYKHIVTVMFVAKILYLSYFY